MSRQAAHRAPGGWRLPRHVTVPLWVAIMYWTVSVVAIGRAVWILSDLPGRI